MDLSIIIPVFNSENILEQLIHRIVKSLNNLQINFEIILINDFSHDASWKKIKFLSNEYSNIKGLNLSENYGQHNAIMAGLNECKGNNIITMDDDLQHPPESIKDIYNELSKNYDACYVNYINRQHPVWKRFVSWLNNVVSSYLMRKPLKIYTSSFKGFKRNVLQEIIKYQGSKVFLDGLILKATKNISMVSVPHHKRLSGKSNYDFKKLISLWSDMAINCPVYPIRLSTFFVIIIKYLILIYRNNFYRNEKIKNQYSIKEKTYR